MTLNLTTFDAALKEYYTEDKINDLVYKDRPLFAMMPKMKEFYGDSLPIPIIHGNPQGRSADFTRAQARSTQTSSLLKRFLLTRNHDYSIVTIDNETLLASENNKGAFLEARTVEINGSMSSLSRSLSTALYRTGFGEIGQITGAVTGTTITLAQTDDIVNFEVGMELVVAAAVGTGATRALGSSGNGLIVTAINRSTGVLTFGFNVNDATNGIPAIATADYLFVRGDRDTATTPVRQKVAGLEGWLPAGGPTSTAFFGVDRTVDATRLGGLSYNGAGVPIEEALIEGATRVGREGGRLTHYFMNFANWSNLEKSLGSKVQYVDLMVGKIGFRGIRVHGPKGEIMVVPDQDCPNNRIFGLQMDTWKLYSLGEPIRVIDTDDLQMLRQSSADGVEVRHGYYSQLGCNAPGWNINIQV